MLFYEWLVIVFILFPFISWKTFQMLKSFLHSFITLASLHHYTPEDHQTKLERLTDSKDKTEVVSSKPPPPSHLQDALVKEEEENSSDNVEKPPKRRKIKREIIRPDPKYKGKSILLTFEFSHASSMISFHIFS